MRKNFLFSIFNLRFLIYKQAATNNKQQIRRFCAAGPAAKTILAILILAAGCAEQSGGPSARQVAGEFYADIVGKLPGDVIEGSKETFTRRDNMTALLLAGAASVGMHNSEADDHFYHNNERHRAFKDEFSDEGFEIMGGPGAHFAATAIWCMLSSANQDELNKERSWTMMTALSITGLTTLGLKAARNNESPNGKDLAWPSGHTSSSFTVASVLDEFYGPKVGIPAYALASVVAWRMMDTGDHWASDVVFGATLGWVVGHTIAGKGKELEVAGFKVIPVVAGGRGPAAGVSIVKYF